MNISAINPSQNFKARIKLSPANEEKLIKTALVTTSTIGGLASTAAGVDSSRIVLDKAPTVYDSFLSPESQECIKATLLNHAPEGIPVQSTTVPSFLLYL